MPVILNPMSSSRSWPCFVIIASVSHQLYSRICNTQTPTKTQLVLIYEKYLEHQSSHTEYGPHSMCITCCVAL